MNTLAVLSGILAAILVPVLSADPSTNLIPTYGPDLLPGYSELDPAVSQSAVPVMSGTDMLRMAVPGNPGEDYPIYAEVPETAFSCAGRVDGGYYADTEAECQPFHVCTAGGEGELAQYSFLCPNGTLFNQENFVCEYWFNVDCSQAESFYGLNDNIGEVPDSNGLAGAASSPAEGYASAPGSPSSAPGGYGSPSGGVASISGYSALRSGRREGRVISEPRINGARNSAQVTISKNTQSRFVNFKQIGKNPILGQTNKLPSILTSTNKPRRNKGFSNNVSVSKQDSQGFSRNSDTVRGRKQISNLSSDVVFTTQRSRNLSNRAKKGRNQSKTKDIKNNKSTARNQKQNKPNRGNRKQVQLRNKDSNQSTRKGKEFRNFKQINRKQQGRAGRQEVGTGYLPPVEDVSFPADSYAVEDEYLAGSSLTDSYAAGDANLAGSSPTDSYAAGDANLAGSSPADSYDAGDAKFVGSSPDYDYEEAPLPTYAGASDTAGQSSYISSGADTGYAAGSADTYYEAPADNIGDVDALEDAVYEEDTLPTYNNGVYSNGNSDDGASYSAPVADAIYGSPIADSDYEEDILPAYNNGVYNDVRSDSATVEGTSYTAPSPDSYGAPADSADTGYGAPDDSYGAPGGGVSASVSNTIPGSYQDPKADILPEYFKSEITLGLNGLDDVPRVDPFLSDYGSSAGDSYSVAGSSPLATVVKTPLATPDLTYGVPAAPTISLADYNIQEVSDKGFSGLGGSSYGR